MATTSEMLQLEEKLPGDAGNSSFAEWKNKATGRVARIVLETEAKPFLL